MINNNKDNVINFTNLTGVRNKNKTNEYKVCLFENKNMSSLLKRVAEKTQKILSAISMRKGC